MAEPLHIFGAGGLAREILELLRDLDPEGSTWAPAGFVADERPGPGGPTLELPIRSPKELRRGDAVVVGVGAPAPRQRIVERLRKAGCTFPPLVHPLARTPRRMGIPDGTIITAGCIITCDVTLGSHVLVNLDCTIGHDAVVGDFVTLSPGVHVSGNVTIGEGTDVGTGATIVQGCRIGSWSVIGAGAVVSRDLPSDCTAVGIPAKPIKTRPAGWQLQ